MSFLESWARERGYKTLVLRAADPIPVRFYQKLGYRLLEGGGMLNPDKIDLYSIRENRWFSKNISQK